MTKKKVFQETPKNQKKKANVQNQQQQPIKPPHPSSLFSTKPSLNLNPSAPPSSSSSQKTKSQSNLAIQKKVSFFPKGKKNTSTPKPDEPVPDLHLIRSKTKPLTHPLIQKTNLNLFQLKAFPLKSHSSSSDPVPNKFQSQPHHPHSLSKEFPSTHPSKPKAKHSITFSISLQSLLFPLPFPLLHH